MSACGSCGSRVRSTAGYCSTCGTALNAGSSPTLVSNPDAPQPLAKAPSSQVEILTEVTGGGSAFGGRMTSSTEPSVLSGSEIRVGSRRRWIGAVGIALAVAIGWSFLFGSSVSDPSDVADLEVPGSEVPDSEVTDNASGGSDLTPLRVVGGVEECVLREPDESHNEQSDDTALDDTALDDTALDDTALDDTALDDTALDDTALDSTAPDGDDPGVQNAGGNEVPQTDTEEGSEASECQLVSAYQLQDSEGERIDAQLLDSLPPLFVVTDNHLDRVDLVNGTLERSDLMVSRVVYRTPSYLVLYTSEGTVALGADDFAGDPLLLTKEQDVYVMPGPDNSSSWLAEYGSADVVFRLIDLDTGAVLRTVDPERDGFDSSPFSTGLVNESGSGVYEETNDGYRRFAEGWLVAASDTTTLIRRCDERRECSYVWRDRADGTELDYPEFRPVESYKWGLRFSDGGHWVSHLSEDQGRLHEVQTGRVVRLGSVGGGSGSEFEPAVQISADGMWAVYVGRLAERITVVDLRTELAYSIEIEGRVDQVFFAAPQVEE